MKSTEIGLVDNINEESNAIVKYLNLLHELEESELEEEDKKEIESVIKEIISDELNHISLLKDLFERLSEIEEAKKWNNCIKKQ